jgi:hypothetical protein
LPVIIDANSSTETHRDWVASSILKSRLWKFHVFPKGVN